MNDPLSPLQALLKCRDKAGSDSQLARDLGVPQSTMWRWINETKKLPAEYVLLAERRFGVSRHELRPDIYPIERSRPRRRRWPSTCEGVAA